MSSEKKKRGFRKFWADAWKEQMRPKVALKVLSGGHALTDNVAGKGLHHFNLVKGDNPGEVIADTGFSKKSFTFEKVAWEQSGQRSAGKAAAGAIVGTLAAGPLGTIAGAAVGGRRKDTSSAYLYLIDAAGEQHEIHIECTKEQYIEIGRLPY